MIRITKRSVACISTSLLLTLLCSGCVAGGRKYTIGWWGISAEATAATQSPSRSNDASAARQEVAQQSPPPVYTATGSAIASSSAGYSVVSQTSTPLVAGTQFAPQ